MNFFTGCTIGPKIQNAVVYQTHIGDGENAGFSFFLLPKTEIYTKLLFFCCQLLFWGDKN